MLFCFGSRNSQRMDCSASSARHFWAGTRCASSLFGLLRWNVHRMQFASFSQVVVVSPYSCLMLARIVTSILFWSHLAKRDDRLLLIYIAALVGAFSGAKIVYVGA